MFKYLFKIYKLKQLIKLREWHLQNKHVYTQAMIECHKENNIQQAVIAWDNAEIHRVAAWQLETKLNYTNNGIPNNNHIF